MEKYLACFGNEIFAEFEVSVDIRNEARKVAKGKFEGGVTSILS